MIKIKKGKTYRTTGDKLKDGEYYTMFFGGNWCPAVAVFKSEGNPVEEHSSVHTGKFKLVTDKKRVKAWFICNSDSADGSEYRLERDELFIDDRSIRLATIEERAWLISSIDAGEVLPFPKPVDVEIQKMKQEIGLCGKYIQ